MLIKKLSEIEEKLKKEHIVIKSRYVKLKKFKYAVLILKRTLLLLLIGLSFLNPLIIIVSSSVPIIDSIMLITNKDNEVSHLKYKRIFLTKLLKKFKSKNILLKMIMKLKNTFKKYMVK